MRLPLALLTLGVLLAQALSAQKTQKTAPIPARPRLDAGADTNDARSYYRYGMQMASTKPAESVRAFYWAAQIDPSSAEAMYALRTSSLLAMTNSDLFAYFDWTRKKRPPEFLALDSLLYRAYTVNPFLYRAMDLPLIRAVIEADVINQYPSVDRAELDVYVLDQMNAMRKMGRMSYAEGRLPDALAAFAKQLTDTRRSKKDHAENDSEIHADRARVFYQMGNMDSARAELTWAIANMRDRDTKSIVILYQSKAMYEQSLGMIDERSGKLNDAREAYGRALTEDLSYYAAHSLLSRLELGQGDTTTSLSEMDLAVQLQPNDPALRYSYAVLLVQSGRRDLDAVQQLMKAIALDPYYAAPRLLLARISDAEEYTEAAVKGYQDYISLTPRSDPQLPAVRTRLAALTSAVASTTVSP